MHDNKAHPLLAQIPLTVSPFVSLPTATTLPYTYKTLPSTLPPSSTASNDGSEKPKFIYSTSGHAAHPDEIIESCRILQNHIQKLQNDADQTLKKWQSDIEDQDLAEKRRIAPGWLDRNERILEPERKTVPASPAQKQEFDQSAQVRSDKDAPQIVQSREGEEIDRAFGGLHITR